MKLREHWSLFLRGWRLMVRLSTAYTRNLILLSLTEAVAPYVPLYFSARVVDSLHQGAPAEALMLDVSLTVGLSFALSMLGTWLRARERYLGNAYYRAEEWLYAEKIMEMDYAALEDRETRLLYERIKKERQTGYNLFFLETTLRKLVLNGTRIAASISLTLSLFLHPSVSAVGKLGVLVGVGIMVAYSLLASKKTAQIDAHIMDHCVDANVTGGKLSEIFADYSFGMDLRLYDMGDRMAKASADVNRFFYDATAAGYRKKLLFQLPGTAITELLRFGLYCVLIAAALSGEITVGSIAQYVACCFLLLGAVEALVEAMQMLFANNVYLARYFSYFDIPNTMYQGTLTLPKRDDNQYEVEFRDVSFRYPNTQAWALRHVDLKFKVGEKLAMVGENGSGKTTLIKLLCRLYDPTEGQILLNGVDIRKYDYDEYRAAFSVVFQDFKLFSMTLGQNVATSETVDEQKARESLRKAGFGDRLETLPRGLETCLYKDYDDSGLEISGGEAQKIALARALYKDAPFIILDEPTSALDPISEYQVYAGFNNIAGDKTTIYISHRLASCRFCDKIAVFDRGSIIQTGTHEGLLRESEGKYFALWNAQAQYYVTKQK